MPSAQPNSGHGNSTLTVGFCLFLVIAAFFLWTEHRAHLLGALPYLILLACPFIHLFMHRHHGTHGSVGPHRDHGTADVPREAGAVHQHGERS